jgi:imidazolonepropionase-like amidohydrolase
VWESTYIARAGEVSKLDAPMFARMPMQVQRGIKAGGEALTVPDAVTDKQYRASYANMVRMLKKLYDSGIQIVAGTDAGKGYAFDRELEIYNEAGIPASEVLRMATIEAAPIMRKDKELGSITPGKFADMILVSGDPTNNANGLSAKRKLVRNRLLRSKSGDEPRCSSRRLPDGWIRNPRPEPVAG